METVREQVERWLTVMPEKTAFQLTRHQISQLLREIDVLKERTESSLMALDELADLLADSGDLPVEQTPAVRRLNEIIDSWARK